MTATSPPTGTTAPPFQRLATWLFVVPPLFGYVRAPDGDYVYPKMGLLALAGIAILFLLAVGTHAFPARTFAMIAGTAGLLFTLLALYTLSWPHLRGFAFGEPSLKSGIVAAGSCSMAVLYFCIFYREEILLDVFWKVSSLAVAIGLAAYFANSFTGSDWFVHLQYGTTRLQGFMSEPSSWAPYLPALVLLSLERRRRIAAAAFLIAGILAKSPTVLLVFAVSIPAYYILAERRSSRRILALASLAVFGTLVAYGLQHVNTSAQSSSSARDQPIVRLVAGIENVTSSGARGQNDRFAGAQLVVGELVEHGWLATGIGPGCEGYINQATGVLPYSLPLYVLCSFGITGLLILAALLFLTITRLRTCRSFRLFLPFIVASFINSADGWENYKFVVVAIVAAIGLPASRRFLCDRKEAVVAR
jgi:hypothetical protein